MAPSEVQEQVKRKEQKGRHMEKSQQGQGEASDDITDPSSCGTGAAMHTRCPQKARPESGSPFATT